SAFRGDTVGKALGGAPVLGVQKLHVLSPIATPFTGEGHPTRWRGANMDPGPNSSPEFKSPVQVPSSSPEVKSRGQVPRDKSRVRPSALLLEPEALDLAGLRLGQGGDELHRARVFVRGNCRLHVVLQTFD